MLCPEGEGAPQFRLRPVYASSDDAELIFRYVDGALAGQSARMELVPTAYASSSSVSAMVRAFIGTYRSVPALLANIVMEGFNSMTTSS